MKHFFTLLLCLLMIMPAEAQKKKSKGGKKAYSAHKSSSKKSSKSSSKKKKTVTKRVVVAPVENAVFVVNTDMDVQIYLNNARRIVYKDQKTPLKINHRPGKCNVFVRNMKGDLLFNESLELSPGENKEYNFDYGQKGVAGAANTTTILPLSFKAEEKVETATTVPVVIPVEAPMPEKSVTLTKELAIEMYQSGNLNEACQYLMKNTDETSLSADELVILGNCYKLKLKDSQPNYKKAVEVLTMASMKGDVSHSALVLGEIYSTGGHGIEKNSEKALTYFRNSSDEGNYVAKYELGKMYMSGTGGVFRDERVGVSFLEQAAYNDVKAAQRLLADIYGKGTNFIDKDLNKSKYWLTRIAGNTKDK